MPPLVLGGLQRSTFVGGALPGPLFKWVRITAKTERSANMDVNGDGILDPANTPVYYDGANQYIDAGNFGFNPCSMRPRQLYRSSSSLRL